MNWENHVPRKKKRKKEKQNGDITAQRIVGGEVKNVIAAFKYSNI